MPLMTNAKKNLIEYCNNSFNCFAKDKVILYLFFFLSIYNKPQPPDIMSSLETRYRTPATKIKPEPINKNKDTR